MEERYYTPYEVAEKYKVVPMTVWRWIKSGKLKAIKIGGGVHYRISESALRDFEKGSF